MSLKNTLKHMNNIILQITRNVKNTFVDDILKMQRMHGLIRKVTTVRSDFEI